MKVCLTFYSLLFFSTGYAIRNVTHPDSKLTDTEKSVIKMLQSCSQSGLVHSLGLIRATDVFLSAVSSELLVSKLIKRPYTSKRPEGTEVLEGPREKVQFVIESFRTAREYDPSAKSIWFRFAEKVILVERNEHLYCRRFSSFLRQTWLVYSMNSIYFVCRDVDHVVYIYTYNEFNDKVPTQWKISKVSRPVPGKFYKREFTDELPCKSLFVDKLLTHEKKLVHVIVEPTQLISFNFDGPLDLKNKTNGNQRIRLSPPEWKFVKGFDGQILGALFKTLNATVELTVDYSGTPYRYYYRFVSTWFTTKRCQGFCFDLFLNSRDLALSLDVFPQTYPVGYRDVAVITRRRGPVATPTRLIRFFTTGVLLSTVIVLLLLVFVLGILSGQGLASGALNALRFVLGISQHVMPTGLPIRMLLGCLMPYFLLSILNLQGYLAYMMTIPVAMPDADSIEELTTSSYTIFAELGFNQFLRFFNNPGCQFEKYGNYSCPELVFKNSRAACIEDADYLKREAASDQRLHVVKESLATISSSFPVTQKWPLRERLNSLLLRLEESGILRRWWKQQRDNDNLIPKDEPAAENFKPVTFKQCAGCFFVLFGGLALSTVVFIVELVYSRE